jgi:hypothetical protein
LRSAVVFAVSATREIVARMGIGAILVVVGIVLAFIDRLFLGLILIVLGLAFGGFRRGRWY